MKKRVVQKLSSITMLIVLLIQSVFSPVMAIAETISSDNEEVTFQSLTVEENDETSATVRLEAVISNENEEAKTVIIDTNLATQVVGDTSLPVTTTADSIKVEAAAKENSKLVLRLNVAKTLTNTDQVFTVKNGEQRKEVVLLGQVHESETQVSKTEETSSEDKEDSEQTSSSSEISTSESESDDANEMTSETSNEASKEKKVVTQADEPRNIKDLMKADDQFFTNVEAKINDKAIEDGQVINAEDLIELIYHWEIPSHLLTGDEAGLHAGDYYETTLPEGIQYSNVSGDLKADDGTVYGTYSIKEDGTMRLTFNDKIETEHDIKGTVSYMQKVDNDGEAGNTTITFPVDGGDKEINVVVKPTGGQSISKEVTNDVKNNKVTWKVSINTNLNTLNNATVTDPMPEGLELSNTTIYKQTIDSSGKVVSVDTAHPLVAGKDYEVDGNVIKFVGDYAKTNESFQIVYETTVKDTIIPEEGGPVKFTNTAILKDDTSGEQSAKAETTMTYGKLIDKSFNKTDDENYGTVYKWQIKYNYGNKNLPKNSYVTDTLGNPNLEFIEDSVVVKTVSGKTLVKGTDYNLEFNGQSMKVTFPNGIDEAVNVDYKTKFNKIIDDDVKGDEAKLTNKVITDSGFEGGSSGSIATDGFVKGADIDYANRKINWTITINKYKYEMANWYLEDTLSKNLTLDADSIVMQDSDGKTLTKDADYKVTVDGQKFKVEFLGDLKKGTDKTYKLTYTTDFARREGDLSNGASSHWQDHNGDNHTNSTDHKPTIKEEYKSDATKGGSYNAQTKHITWTTKVNYTQDTLKEATITDPIIGDQDYVPGSAKLYEVTINKNGTVEPGAEVKDADISYDAASKTITAKLPDGDKAYDLVFETSLEGKVIDQAQYKNTATYKNGDTYTTNVDAKVDVKNGNVFASKSGEQDPSNTNYATWAVTINPSQSTMKNVVITDTPSTNQVFNEESFKIYGAKVAKNGDITKDPSVVLEEGKDYTVEIVTDNETGQQVATIKMNGTIDKAYILEYKSLITADKNGENTLTNKISIKGEGEKQVDSGTEGSTKVVVSNGTAEGSKASVTIAKLDSDDNKTPLKGAKLELWSTSNGKKEQLVRSGTTDENGQIKFGNLRANYSYLLFETQAPAGYTVSDELKNGKEIKLTADKEGHEFATVEIKNAIPEVSFNKVDANGKALPGAVFAVKNEDSRYYNGLKADKSVKWVERGEISAETKKALTSDGNGKVTIKGLPIGNYQLVELSAPEGYELFEGIIDFEVVNIDGQIQLKDAIADVKNEATQYVDIPVEKVWDDKENQDGIRPEKVTIELYADGKATDKTVELSEENNWQASFTKLRKTDSTTKEEIKYTVKEKDADKNYKSNVTGSIADGFKIKNSYTPAKTQVSVKKAWNDKDNQDGIRPDSVKVQLYANEEEVGESIELSGVNKWETTWKDLDLKANGETIDYTVKEVDENPGYTVEVNGNAKDGYILTNSHTPETINISGAKTWDDNDNQDGKRPTSITVYLMKGTEVVKTGKVTAKDGWTYEFTNLPKYENGEEINYTIFEDEVTDYSTENDGYDLTNTHTPGKTSISVTKAWEDAQDQDGKRPDTVEVVLTADGKETEQKVTLNAENNWTANFTDLDEYKTGKLISYGVKEISVSDYEVTITEVQEGNFVVTNAHEPEVTEISGTKTWDDADNQDGKRPTSIKVRLYANEVEVDKLNVTAADDWEYSFTDLPKYQEGEVIDYTVKEDAVPEYETKQEGTNFTNIHEPELTGVKGTKTWDDADNQDGKRPETIIVNLLANGEVTQTAEVTEETDWTYEFANLPKYESGKEITYAIQEVTISDYSSEISGTDITNTHTPGKTSVNVLKVWDDAENQDGVRPGSIEVILLANDEEFETKTLDATNNWQTDFSDLDEYKNGKKIVYTVKEVENDGYESLITGDADNGFVVKNTHEPATISINGIKTWDDNDNQDGKRPESITVNLMVNGVVIDHVRVSAETDWSYAFTDLPQFEKGQEIDYVIQETGVEEYQPGYVTEVNPETSDQTVNILNTHTPGKTSVTVNKVWYDADNQDGLRTDEVIIKLLADGEETGKTVTLSPENNWQDIFTDLDEYQDGQPIVYTVEEESIDGYVAEVSGNVDEGYIVQNTHKPELIDISGAKTWVDNDNQDSKRPEYITVHVMNGDKVVQTAKVTAESDWTYEFTDLPKFANGEEINYTIFEDKVADYSSTVKGYDVTNMHTPDQVSINVVKDWKDKGDKDGIRPDEITVKLLADGKDTGKTLVLKKTDKWQGAFTGLDEYKDGKKISYTISENAVKGYTAAISEVSDENFVITNTHKVKQPTKKPGKTQKGKLPQTGSNENAWIISMIGLVLVISVVGYTLKTKKNN